MFFLWLVDRLDGMYFSSCAFQVDQSHPYHSYYFVPDLTPSFFLRWVHHELSCCSHLLLCHQARQSYHVFIAARSGFSFFVWALCGVLGIVFLQYFSLFHRVPSAMQQACFSFGWLIAWMVCIFRLALSRSTSLMVGGQGGLSSLLFPDMTGMVGICSNCIVISCSIFVDFFATSIILNSFQVDL